MQHIMQLCRPQSPCRGRRPWAPSARLGGSSTPRSRTPRSSILHASVPHASVQHARPAALVHLQGTLKGARVARGCASAIGGNGGGLQTAAASNGDGVRRRGGGVRRRGGGSRRWRQGAGVETLEAAHRTAAIKTKTIAAAEPLPPPLSTVRRAHAHQQGLRLGRLFARRERVDGG